MTLKEFVIAHVKPDKYYASRFPNWSPRIRENVRCIFHEDGSPSLSLSLRNGGARCHAASCGKRAGNIVHFESLKTGESEKIVAKRLYKEFIRPVVSRKRVADYRNCLLSEGGDYLLKIKKEMGLNGAAVRRYGLGLDKDNHRITIPIYDQFGQIVNIRFYRLPSDREETDSTKIFNLKGYGKLDLFPWPDLSAFRIDRALFFMASEKEAMLANAMGFAAFTTTAGEGSWDDSWNPMFEGRTIYIVFDRDKGGSDATQKMLAKLATIANCHVVKLPFKSKRSDRKDFADWILREHHSADEFRRLLKPVRARAARSISVEVDVPSPSVPALPPLIRKKPFDIIAIRYNTALINQRIRVEGIVASMNTAHFRIPWRFKIKSKGRSTEYRLPIGRELIKFVKSSDTIVNLDIAQLAGCSPEQIEILDYVNAIEVEIVPTVVIDKDTPYVSQKCYCVGVQIEANTPYEMEVIPISEVRTHETIGIITDVKAKARSSDQFQLTPELEADLAPFRPEGESVYAKLLAMADSLAVHYTHIHHRRDWHVVAALSYASPIGFRLPDDDSVQRGWINSLALGDTETGKSKVTEKLQKLFNCGVYVNSENCTYVGLIGGAIKNGSGQFMLRWGRIPLSDKQLVILEELSGLSIDEISNMSDVRSSGVARLDKGGINSQTSARTRLICLSNSRDRDKQLGEYAYGVHAIKDLIGHGEDIARFDFITTLVDREVSIASINSEDNLAMVAKHKDLYETIATDQWQKLIQFIWSLKPDQIKFSHDAYTTCLSETRRLSEIYHSSIPIFKGGSGRYKLARIAAAIACFQFAWDGQSIKVTKHHVRAAAKFLQSIYDKPSFGYLEYSQQSYDREEIKDKTLLKQSLLDAVSTRSLPKVLESIIHAGRFTKEDLAAFTGSNELRANQLIGTMVTERAVKKGQANKWEVTRAGKDFFHSLMRNGSNGNGYHP